MNDNEHDDGIRDALAAMARQFDGEAALEDELGTLTSSGEWGRQYQRRQVDEHGKEWPVITNTDVQGRPRVERRYGGDVDPGALT